MKKLLTICDHCGKERSDRTVGGQLMLTLSDYPGGPFHFCCEDCLIEFLTKKKGQP